jgi:bifunctional oligoribonuclease and PAP phosphatase NrnA
MSNKIIAAINEGQSFLITAHVRLDGDALGSELALYLMLKDMGKKAIVYNQDDTPEHYRFLPGAQNIVHELGDIGQYDVGVVLDCSNLERVGEKSAQIGKIKTLINIDHHISNGGFCLLSMLDGQASSTGELLYRLMSEMRCNMTKDICTNLYAAIITDTGGFRYSSTHRDTLLTAGDLVGNGANPQWISENIYENDSPARLKLLAKVLKTMSLDLENKVGSLFVTQEALRQTGASLDHTEGFIDIPRTVKDINISVLYTQLENKYFKVSLRSKGQINVEKVARKFGGGGHINAAACRITGNIETIKLQVLEAIKEI